MYVYIYTYIHTYIHIYIYIYIYIYIEDGEHWQRGIGSWEVFILHKFASLSKRLPQVLKIKRGCDKNDKFDGNSIKMTNPVYFYLVLFVL